MPAECPEWCRRRDLEVDPAERSGRRPGMTPLRWLRAASAHGQCQRPPSGSSPGFAVKVVDNTAEVGALLALNATTSVSVRRTRIAGSAVPRVMEQVGAADVDGGEVDDRSWFAGVDAAAVGSRLRCRRWLRPWCLRRGRGSERTRGV